jgi:hypothetical protein
LTGRQLVKGLKVLLKQIFQREGGERLTPAQRLQDIAQASAWCAGTG